ncbi:MAG: hypothetical protein A2X28_03950 [Elusimicrobia bacterium GWA2_56_46]|nr:MAG: hypothetical protein A2X28_03950 [Elusimicrobia bacterium GWA2_56_46]OGR55026.1 MAG: hypothetical protein A2X39_02885 [Elusimicrobia bacterium GWC2_56_31]HBB67213.1 hypothetical protein [Elusimicrobiota bacterium]HBW23960.1 hypothetical protein [Elusimicrobiota bacterium]
MTAIIFYLVMAALAGYYVRKYKTTGDGRHLKSAGALVAVATFFAAFGRGAEGVLFPEKAWLAYVVLAGGSLASALLMTAGYEGGRKVYALVQVAGFFVITAFLISCLPYFRATILVARAQKSCARVVPGSEVKRVYGLNAAQRGELAPKFAEALASRDRFVRLGALYSMAYMPKSCVVVLPTMIQLLATADDDELYAAAVLLEQMGPEAVSALSALEARLVGADGRTRSRVEAALKALRPQK